MRGDNLHILIDRITRERAEQLRPGIMQQVLDNVYSGISYDDDGRPSDPKMLSERRTRFLGELITQAHEDEKAGRITSMERAAIHEAVSQIWTELAYGYDFARRHRH
jgi:hypothetical protein